MYAARDSNCNRPNRACDVVCNKKQMAKQTVTKIKKKEKCSLGKKKTSFYRTLAAFVVFACEIRIVRLNEHRDVCVSFAHRRQREAVATNDDVRHRARHAGGVDGVVQRLRVEASTTDIVKPIDDDARRRLINLQALEHVERRRNKDRQRVRARTSMRSESNLDLKERERERLESVLMRKFRESTKQLFAQRKRDRNALA